jgi:hypothetical protein
MAPVPATDNGFAFRQTGLLKMLAGGLYGHKSVGLVKEAGDAYSFHEFASDVLIKSPIKRSTMLPCTPHTLVKDYPP